MARIGIVGFGYVGQAVANSYAHRTVIVRDPKLAHSACIEEFSKCSAIFVCVPSPELPNGDCDTSILTKVLDEFKHLPHLPIICKTTATPATYKSLITYYPNIVHCPEFLTASNHISDYKNANYFVVGGNTAWVDRSIKVIADGVPLPENNFLKTDIQTAALYKYMMNCYLASKVTFMNEFHNLASNLSINWDNVVSLAKHDSRIGNSHMQVPGADGRFGWGGACFPKDTSAIIAEGMRVASPMPFTEFIKDLNALQRNRG